MKVDTFDVFEVTWFTAKGGRYPPYLKVNARKADRLLCPSIASDVRFLPPKQCRLSNHLESQGRHFESFPPYQEMCYLLQESSEIICVAV